MTFVTTRAVSIVLLAGCLLWAGGAVSELVAVSPVHWPILAPSLMLGGVPAAAATATALASLKGSTAARPLALAFLLTLAQAVAVSLLTPELYLR